MSAGDKHFDMTPPTISDHRAAPVNALGYLRLMFTVEDIGEMVHTRTCIGSATFAEPKDFLSGWQNNSITNE